MRQFHSCKFVEKGCKGIYRSKNQSAFIFQLDAVFFYFILFLYQNFGEIEPQKKKKKIQFYSRRTNS